MKQKHLSADTGYLITKRKLEMENAHIKKKKVVFYCWKQHISKSATVTLKVNNDCFWSFPLKAA